MNAQTSPREKLVSLVADILKRNGIEGPVDTQADLIGQGLTSVDMVHLMLAIEAAFDLTIPQSGLTPENFRSIATIETLLGTLTPAEATP
ncbi:phosphopantetheine-binding protein [uncultured Methylovirgula sp.]|uniref:phosphopantetheine-binding protein n=1 Tax=uncultured Methylovirgula sp. TaxID=1285960 RepID=UPI00260FD0FE|nr:phosphopantetheine-binding protein [uncultured Methylovirgula sp.]